MLDFPAKIQIQTINRCNYACRMCPYPAVAEGTHLAHFDEDLFRRLIDEVRQAGRRVRLCLMLQNEPLLDRRFLDFLRYAHNAEDAVSSISTVTNGSTLTLELLDQLTAFERLRLTISVNANNSETYREVHQRDLWDKVHGLLAGWRGERGRVRVSFVFDTNSIAGAAEFRRRWTQAGYATRLVAINARVDSLPAGDLFHSVDEDFSYCTYPVDTLTVLVDGSVILCCNDWDHRVRFGDLHRASITEVWNSPRFQEFRRGALDGTLRRFEACEGCDYPMRSADRMRLEALVSGATDPLSGKEGGILEHAGEVRSSTGGEPLPVLVWSLDADAGSITALTALPAAELPSAVRFRLSIAISGICSFSSLEPVWCPGKLTALVPVSGLPGFTPVRIELDAAAPEYRFFRWYHADWQVPTPQPLPHSQGGSRGEKSTVV